MKHRYIFLQIFILISIISFAQKKSDNYKFHSINSLSFLNGENEVSAGLQSVNGFQKGSWFGGIGVGIDYYIYRTVPVFADIRYEFGKNQNKFFAYADGGISFTWKADVQGAPIMDWPVNPSVSKYFNGYFTDAGFGYSIHMKKAGAFVLSLGHSHKTLREDVTYTDWRTQQLTTDIYRYRFNRIAVKVGWRF